MWKRATHLLFLLAFIFGLSFSYGEVICFHINEKEVHSEKASLSDMASSDEVHFPLVREASTVKISNDYDFSLNTSCDWIKASPRKLNLPLSIKPSLNKSPSVTLLTSVRLLI